MFIQVGCSNIEQAGMQSQMMYAGKRSAAAREMAMEMMAPDQRQMGSSCSLLGRFISRVFKCRGKCTYHFTYAKLLAIIIQLDTYMLINYICTHAYM